MLTSTATVFGVNVWLFPFEVQHLVNLFKNKNKKNLSLKNLFLV